MSELWSETHLCLKSSSSKLYSEILRVHLLYPCNSICNSHALLLVRLKNKAWSLWIKNLWWCFYQFFYEGKWLKKIIFLWFYQTLTYGVKKPVWTNQKAAWLVLFCSLGITLAFGTVAQKTNRNSNEKVGNVCSLAKNPLLTLRLCRYTWFSPNPSMRWY